MLKKLWLVVLVLNGYSHQNACERNNNLPPPSLAGMFRRGFTEFAHQQRKLPYPDATRIQTSRTADRSSRRQPSTHVNKTTQPLQNRHKVDTPTAREVHDDQHGKLTRKSNPKNIDSPRVPGNLCHDAEALSYPENTEDFDPSSSNPEMVLDMPLETNTSFQKISPEVISDTNRKFGILKQGRSIGPGPVATPWPQICEESGEEENYITGTLPEDVCDRCPVTIDHKNPLDPCTCVGNTGAGAGMISITCPNTIINDEQLEEILTTPDYFTTHVYRFTLRGSNVSGVISQSYWGDLDFRQVVIENNRFHHVDNKAFANSADTINYLSLYNNKIIEYFTSTENELPNLEILNLKGNELPFIYSNAFTYRSLRIFDLSYNLIAGIGKDSFAELDKLEELYLNNNQLTTLKTDTFKFTHHNPASNFLQIDLSNNNISFISDNAFAGLRNVQINLLNNRLTTLSETVFKQILIDSQYYAFIYVADNPIQCNCDIYWMVEDPHLKSCFDSFVCADSGLPITVISTADLGNCTTTVLSFK